MNRGGTKKKDVRLFLRPGKPEKANNLIINSLWIVFYVEWHQLLLRADTEIRTISEQRSSFTVGN